ncbi:hypothetical protein [Actinobaculum sp. 352]|uniref:hypothetical protein n=1 Tax=Actinobaculum sp. 352 TaxID=2490946 RepID=UPI000F7E6AD0|nr:hypothetical protein [Actinobaculum sp. 352]RTE47730.1 hypothetical protein EKN07_12130 [Actinobaculum sp. 352]
MTDINIHGMTLSIDANLFDDFELVADIADMEAGQTLKVVPIVRRIVGDHYQDMLDVLRDPATGRVPLDAVSQMIVEIMQEVAPNLPRSSEQTD